jgi:N-glycosylase/DNA lyase
VDTHVWDIVVRDYDSSLSAAKSLTPTVYESVGDIFRQRFKSHAGWAHSVLFAAELPEFRALLPEHIVAEMLEFANQRRLQSAEKKAAQRSRLAEKISAAAVNADDPNDLLDMLTPDPSPTAKVSRKSKRQSPNDLL